MSTFTEYLLVIGAFQGLLLFALLSFDMRMSAASRVLGLLCLMMASVLSMPLLLAGRLPLPSWLAGWLFYLPATGGGLAYLYCRSALLGRSPTARDALLFLPWGACYLLAAEPLLTDSAAMLRWIEGERDPGWRLQASEYLVFVQAFTFAGATVRMIARYRRDAANALADYDPRIFRWMLVLQVFTLAIWLLKALPALTPASVVFAQIADLLMVVVIYLIAITQWRDPGFFRVAHLAEEQEAASRAGGAGPSPETSGELDPEARARLFEAIRQTVETQQLYLDSELTLSRLAEVTGLSRHQVSEALNRHAGRNFYEFINGYRVDAVCARLAERPDESILTVGLACGFSSKSTFNAIFKQFTGLTPTAYRRSLADGAR